MKSVKVGLSVVLIAIPLVSAAQTSTCQAVYAESVRNLNVSSQVSFQKISIFKEHCEENGALKSEISKLDLAVPIKTLTAKIGISRDQQQQEMQQFCKTFKDERNRNDAQFSMNDTVAVDALRSYNQCIALEKRNVQISHTSNEESIVVRVDFNPTTSVVALNSLSFDEKMANCTSTILGDGARPITFSTGKVAANGPFVVSCRRTPQTTDRGRRFSRVSFLISTNHGDYDVYMAPETLLNFDMESIARRGIQAFDETLKAEKEASAKLAEMNAKLRDNTRIASAESATLKAKMANPSAQIFSILQGEGAPIPCPQDGGDHLTYVKNSCAAPGVLSVLTKTPEVGGRKCGYRTWQWACVTYP